MPRGGSDAVGEMVRLVLGFVVLAGRGRSDLNTGEVSVVAGVVDLTMSLVFIGSRGSVLSCRRL